MWAELIGLATLAGLAAALYLMLKPRLETVQVSFPPDLEARQSEALLGAVAGLPKHSRVESSVSATGGALSFALTASERDLATLRAAVQGIAPGVRFGAGSPDLPGQPQLRAHVAWRGSYVLLRADQPELATSALLAALRATVGRERLTFTLQLRPLVRPKAPPITAASQRDPDWATELLLFQPPLPRDQLAAIRQQYTGPLLSARLRIDVHASSRRRAQQLVNQVVAVVHSRSGARGRLSVRSHRWAFAGAGTMLAPPELVPFMGWPLGGPRLPGLRYSRAPQLLPDSAIPRRGKGRTFGISTWPGLETRRLIQPPVGSLSHSLLLGPTGSGKSTLLTHLLIGDLRAGHGALLLDMKGDTAVDVLARIPENRYGDVVVVDPADHRPLPGLKAVHASNPELVADLWVGVFRNLFRDSWGVRSERYIKLGVQTLAAQPGSSLTQLPQVFSDVAFRRRLLSRSRDPYLAAAWASFDALSAQQQAEHLTAPLGKIHDILGRERIRAVLGQPDPKLDLARALAQRRIVIVRMRAGVIGQATAQLLGALTIYEAYQAVLSRQAIPEAHRRPFSLYVDEPAVLSALPIPLDSLFELARGLGVGVTLATQSVTQLPDSVRRAALTNVATIVCFRAGADDARLIARELTDVTADELQHLEQYEAAMRLGIDHGLTAPTATIRTLEPSPMTIDPELLRDASSARYGSAAPPAPEPEATADPAPSDVPLGRVRRPS